MHNKTHSHPRRAQISTSIGHHGVSWESRNQLWLANVRRVAIPAKLGNGATPGLCALTWTELAMASLHYLFGWKIVASLFRYICFCRGAVLGRAVGVLVGFALSPNSPQGPIGAPVDGTWVLILALELTHVPTHPLSLASSSR